MEKILVKDLELLNELQKTDEFLSLLKKRTFS